MAVSTAARESIRVGADTPWTPGTGKYNVGAFHQFLKAVRLTRCSRLETDRRAAVRYLEKEFGSPYIEKATMGELSGTTGGYLVPSRISLELLRSLAEKTFIYPRAIVIPMDTLQVDCPVISIRSNPANGSPFFGGIVFTWGLEETPTESEPTFEKVALTAWDLIGHCTVSNQFFSDSGPDAEKTLVDLFTRAGAWQAEYGFLRGTGTPNKMPIGVTVSPATVSVARAGGNAIAAADLAGMTAVLAPGCWDTAIWAANPSTLAQIVKLSNYFVSGTAPVGEKYVGLLAGKPLYLTEKLPALGTKGDIVLFDPGAYVIGERQEVLVDVSPHSRFQNNQTDFRVWLRLDGKPWMTKTVLLADGVTTAGCAVVLT